MRAGNAPAARVARAGMRACEDGMEIEQDVAAGRSSAWH